MMSTRKEFLKYAVKDRGFTSHHVEDYISAVHGPENMTRTVIEERQMPFREVDVFSRLMADRIIFLGTGVDDYIANGDAEANQSNSLSGSITVTVAEVLPNGILAVRGEKWITLNTGDELVRISGLVRSEDISQYNTVLSTRVADARITYSGTGAFANASQPGWLSQFFLSPLWPF